MKIKRMTGTALAVLLAAHVMADGAMAAALVRDATQGRTWQVVFDRSAPLTWRWESADSARLSVSGCVERALVYSSGEIDRASGARKGSCAVPAFANAPAGERRLYVATLSLYAGGTLTNTQTATLALLPGAAGGGVKVASPASTAWSHATGVPILPYDAAWSNATTLASSASLTASWGKNSTTTCILPGTSGYTAFDPPAYAASATGSFALALNFDDQTAVWRATVEIIPSGTIYSFL